MATELATTPTPPAPAAPEVPRRGAVSAAVLPVAGVIVAVAIWWAITAVFDVQAIILPAPDQVVSAFLALRAEMLAQTWSTATAVMIGFGMSALVGVLIGGAIAASRPIERMVQPLLVAFNAVPTVALAPLLLIWLGYGRMPVLAMAFMVCFFPIVLATATGLTSTPADLAELARSMDASRSQLFRWIRLPAALPQIFVGFKIAMPLAVIGVVVGEMQYGESGLGMIIVQTSGQADTASAFAAITLLAVVSVVLYYALVVIERLALPWVAATTSAR
jgi:NitT/TauT family transport system permease protein